MLTRAAICLSTLLLPTFALAEEPKDPRDRIVGVWNSLDRHVSIGSLYQPVHGVRKRKAEIHFEHKGEGLSGHAICAHHREILFQERWKDGRTELGKVRFADNTLSFEYDIAEWRITDGPIAVEEKSLENAG